MRKSNRRDEYFRFFRILLKLIIEKFATIFLHLHISSMTDKTFRERSEIIIRNSTLSDDLKEAWLQMCDKIDNTVGEDRELKRLADKMLKKCIRDFIEEFNQRKKHKSDE